MWAWRANLLQRWTDNCDYQRRGSRWWLLVMCVRTCMCVRGQLCITPPSLATFPLSLYPLRRPWWDTTFHLLIAVIGVCEGEVHVFCSPSASVRELENGILWRAVCLPSSSKMTHFHYSLWDGTEFSVLWPPVYIMICNSKDNLYCDSFHKSTFKQMNVKLMGSAIKSFFFCYRCLSAGMKITNDNISLQLKTVFKFVHKLISRIKWTKKEMRFSLKHHQFMPPFPCSLNPFLNQTG